MIRIEKNISVKEFFENVFDTCEVHWEEIANNKDIIKLDPDVKQYQAMEHIGALKNAVIYDDDKIVGYTVVVSTPHLHYKSDIYSYVDVLFLRPNYRNSRLGFKLVDLSEELAREAGATIIIHHTKPHHPVLEKILRKKGFSHAENIFGKVLE
ncbi:MAG TPA: GNAT family N-acetyltransferase [Methanosarcina sp.]|nr:GNAT family N-acetyltransferase [Methanosarcina sp.]